jgi:dienelactone hydrolase
VVVIISPFVLGTDIVCTRLLRVIMASLVLLLALLILTSCRSTSARAEAMARTAGFQSGILRGAGFAHQAYFSIVPRTETLFVFLEGDGSPWLDHGTRVAPDPTPRIPLALQLAVRTRASVLYLGRPCYFGATSDRECTADLWTSKRYSPPVVASMAAALTAFLASHHFSEVVLVGYSGGGTLAVLMAPRVATVRAVVTIAANLDIAAWTSFHGYLPLEGSLNPVDEPPMTPRLREWHLAGARDRNTPSNLNARYWERISPDHLWIYPEMDHACCWVSRWPDIFSRLQVAMAQDSGRSP